MIGITTDGLVGRFQHRAIVVPLTQSRFPGLRRSYIWEHAGWLPMLAVLFVAAGISARRLKRFAGMGQVPPPLLHKGGRQQAVQLLFSKGSVGVQPGVGNMASS